MQKEYCVYVHTNKTNGKKYVGITANKPVNRWAYGNGYKTNKYFTYAIKKYGWEGFDHEILLSGLTREQACDWERALIAQWDTTDQSKGYNIALGGVGPHSVSDSTKRLKSKQTIEYYRDHPEVRENISRKTKEHYVKHPEARAAISDRMKAFFAENPDKKTTKAIRQYSLSGDFIREWESAREVDMMCGIDFRLISSCLTGKQKSAGGYLWVYAKGECQQKIEGIKSTTPKKVKKRSFEKQCVGVIQYDLDGKFVKTYSSIKDAEIDCGINHSCIISCCRGRSKRAGKYIWRYNDASSPQVTEGYHKFLKRPVAKCDQQGNIIKIYETAMDAAKEHGVDYTAGIHNACKGYKKHFKGFSWKYVEGDTYAVQGI